MGGEASQRGNPLGLEFEEGSCGSEIPNYLLEAGSKNYSNLFLDASHRVEPVNTVVVCAVNEQANRVAFFFPALPLGLRVGMKVSLCV